MADKTPDYTNSSQQCLIAVINLLSQTPLNAQTINECAAALEPEYAKDQVFRALWNLEKGGFAVKSGAGYILSPDLTRIADRIRLSLVEFTRTHLENGYA